MSKISSRLRKSSVGILMMCTAAATGTAIAQTTPKMPNLKARPAWDLRLETSSSGASRLRFSATSWNSGSGPLHLVGGTPNSSTGKQPVFQYILQSDGSWVGYRAGEFVWHPQHNHFHFEGYAKYTLKPTYGGTGRVSSKTTFCVMDNTAVNTSLTGAPSSPYYTECNASYQGLSVGWGDTYAYNLPGQSFDMTNYPNGYYDLRIEIDPQKRIRESNEYDNTSCVRLKITKPRTVQVIRRYC